MDFFAVAGGEDMTPSGPSFYLFIDHFFAETTGGRKSNIPAGISSAALCCMCTRWVAFLRVRLFYLPYRRARALDKN